MDIIKPTIHLNGSGVALGCEDRGGRESPQPRAQRSTAWKGALMELVINAKVNDLFDCDITEPVTLLLGVHHIEADGAVGYGGEVEPTDGPHEVCFMSGATYPLNTPRVDRLFDRLRIDILIAAERYEPDYDGE